MKYEKPIKNNIISKKEAINIINNELSLNLDNSNTIYSSINKGLNVWWFEPDNSRFNADFHLLLCDQFSKTLYCFFLPVGTVPNPKKIFYQRKDFENKSHIEIWADKHEFKDRKMGDEGFLFDKFLKKKVSY